MPALKIGSNEKLEVLADLVYLARHSPAGAELQLRCLDLAAEVLLQGEVCSSISRRGITERWHIWLQTDVPKIRLPDRIRQKIARIGNRDRAELTHSQKLNIR